MKNLTRYLYGLVTHILLAFAFLTILPAHQHGNTKREKKGNTFKAEETKVLAGALSISHDMGNLDFNDYNQAEQRFMYLKPVSDSKPDNTNFQLIRKESLNLHKAIRSV